MALKKTVSGLIFFDDFNRANGAPGANYSITGGTWAISSNKLVSTGGGTACQVTVVGAGNVKNSHVQLTVTKNSLSDYIVLVTRLIGSNNLYLGDVGAATDGTDPNKSRIYKQVSGGYTRLAGGTAIAGLAAGTPYRENFTTLTGEQKLWVNGVLVASSSDATGTLDAAGAFALSYAPQGGSADVVVDDLLICTSRVVTFLGLPAGFKGRAGGVTSAASDGTNPVTVDIAGAQLPLSLVEVINGSSVVADSYSVGDSLGGDTYYFSSLQVVMGGGRVAITGTMSESGPLAATMKGASVAIVGTIRMDGVVQLTGGGSSMSGVIGHFVDNLYPLGRREVTADFSGVHSTNISVTKRPDAISFDYLTAFSSGPSGIGNVLAGVTNRSWRVRADNIAGMVWLSKADNTNTVWEAETLLFSFTGTNIEEIDLAFDQSGNAVVCVERNSGVAGAKQVWLYWFKPSAGTFVLEMVEGGRTPRLLLDNPPDAANSDVTLFYLKTGVGVVYRVQRELYATAHATPHVQEADWYIEDVFYTKGWRVSVFLVEHNAGGTYGQKRLETTLMPYFTEEPMTLAASFAPSVIRQTLIIFTDDPTWDTIYPALKEADLTLDPSFGPGSTLYEALLLHTLYDDEELTLSTSFGTATLTATAEHIITHDLYDKDGLTMGADFKSSGNTLVAILINHVLYDKDSLKLAASFGTGGTLV